MTDSQMPPVANPVPPLPVAAASAAPGTKEQAKSLLKKIYTGRMNRRTYFFGSIIYGFGYGILLYVIDQALTEIFGRGESIVASLINLALGIMWMILSWSFSVRRAHDIGKRWTYLLWLFIPFVNIVIGLILIFRRGDRQDNAFGAPKGGLRLGEVIGLD